MSYTAVISEALCTYVKNRPIKCVLSVFVNWYSKLYSCVFLGVLSVSSCFKFGCGVLQGCILAPVLFNIYVNDLIDRLRVTNHADCTISNDGLYYVADNLILLSPTVFGLQKMLDACTEYGNYPRRARSASAWILFSLWMYVCLYVCMYVSALERKRLIRMT